jgi:hypothetical protein
MEQSKNKTKKRKKTAIIFASKQNEANGSEKLPSFSLRSEMKRNGSEKLPSFSLRSEMEAKFFSLRCEKNEISENKKKTKRKL